MVLKYQCGKLCSKNTKDLKKSEPQEETVAGSRNGRLVDEDQLLLERILQMRLPADPTSGGRIKVENISGFFDHLFVEFQNRKSSFRIEPESGKPGFFGRDHFPVNELSDEERLEVRIRVDDPVSGQFSG